MIGLKKESIDKLIEHETRDLNEVFDSKDEVVRRVVAQTIEDGFFSAEKCQAITDKGYLYAMDVCSWLLQNEIVHEDDLFVWRAVVGSMAEFDAKMQGVAIKAQERKKIQEEGSTK